MLRAALRRAPRHHAPRRGAASLPDALRAVAPGTRPSAAYDALVAAGVLRRDAYQEAELPPLDALHAAVAAQRGGGGGGGGGGFFASLLGAGAAAAAPRGLYLHGGTGCGKTLLMDIFVACAPAAARARRVHFHAFMRDVHARLHAARGAGARGDLLARVAGALLADAGALLCFDEVQVTDVGDALILRRLFDALFAGGLVMVATSNRAPGELYAGGLQRELFLPFVAALAARCDVRALASPTDHRLLASRGGAGGAQPWLAPARGLPPAERAAAARAAGAALERAWAAAARGAREEAVDVPVEGAGRALRVARAVPRARAARFTFDELCRAPLYAGDYAAVARAFSHVFIEGVPRLGMGERNELRRLVTLIDVLYDARVRLTASAAAEPAELFCADDAPGAAGAPPIVAVAPAGAPAGTRVTRVAGAAAAKFDEVFAWDRAVSRLIDMAGDEYLAAARGGAEGEAGGGGGGAGG
jgi:predicted ATPase